MLSDFSAIGAAGAKCPKDFQRVSNDEEVDFGLFRSFRCVSGKCKLCRYAGVYVLCEMAKLSLNIQ